MEDNSGDIKKLEVTLTAEDLFPDVYFAVSKFRFDNFHQQGTSAKRDLLGGFIDRWINKASERIIFRKLLNGKPYEVLNDYFLYKDPKAKNAPDVLGIKCKNSGKVIKFAEFDGASSTWKQLDNCPFIEVKTFRKSQILVSVRDEQFNDDHFYVLTEMDTAPDYLFYFFNKSIFSEENLKEVKIPLDYFVKNTTSAENIIDVPKQIDETPSPARIIGKLRLTAVIKGSGLKTFGIKLNPGEPFKYISSISEVKKIPKGSGYSNNPYQFEQIFDAVSETDHIYVKKPVESGELKFLPFQAYGEGKISVWKVNKGSIYIEALENSSILDKQLEAGKKYKIDLKIMERSSNWDEYFAYESIFNGRNQARKELIEKMNNLCGSSETTDQHNVSS